MFFGRSPRASPHLLGICMVLVLFSVSVSYKLNVPAILLNYNRGLPSNFTVEVVDAGPGDCFEWRSENVLFIEVTPLHDGPDENCSQKAIISSVFDSSERKVTKVTAFHKTNLDAPALICDVITDVISSIEMVSISDELSVGGPPLRVQVIAKTKQGQIFTSINGLRVRYLTVDVISHPGRETDKMIKLSTSTELYNSCDGVQAWESRHLLGNCILVEALYHGTVAIKALLVGTPINTQKILKVLPSIRIQPAASVYLLKHSYVHIGFIDVDNGKSNEVSQHDFQVLDEDKISEIISYNFPEVAAVEYGSTELLFHSPTNRYPEMTLAIHVVKPARLAMRISGGDFEGLEELKTYILVVDMYDSENNLIHPSDEIRVELDYARSEKLINVLYASENGTYVLFQALSPGGDVITAKLSGVQVKDAVHMPEEDVSTAQKILIHRAIEIFPSKTFLPYEKSIMPQKVLLKVTGGTGDYACAISDSTAASIVPFSDDPYILEIHVKNVTNLLVTIFDRSRPSIKATAEIVVRPPIDVGVFPTVAEAEIGGSLVLPTVFYGYDDFSGTPGALPSLRKFDNCSKMEPTVEIIQPFVFIQVKEVDIPPYGQGCLNLVFLCTHPGYSRVNVMFDYQQNATHNTTLKTTTFLACFKKAKPVHHVKSAVLTLGTSKEVAFEGGPRKWPLFKDGHFTELMPTLPGYFDVEVIRDPYRYNKDLTVFRVTCKKLGEIDMTFEIGNEASATLRYPATASAEIKMYCEQPMTLHLKLAQPKNKILKDRSIVKVPFYGKKMFTVEVSLKDSMGRKLANISSLEMEWEVTRPDLAKPVSLRGFETHENAVDGYRKVTRDFMEFEMTGATGHLQVQAKVTKYKSDVLSKQGIVEYDEINEVISQIDLNLVSIRDITPEHYEEKKDARDTKNTDKLVEDATDPKELKKEEL